VNDPVLAGLVFDEAGPENSAPGSTNVFDYWSDPSPASPLFRPSHFFDRCLTAARWLEHEHNFAGVVSGFDGP
jgi:hypothetical protein